MLASDVNNPAFAGATNPDIVLSKWFFSKPVQVPFLTAKEGRPIFRDIIYIHIEAPGDRTSIIERPKYEDDEQRFPLEWAAYKNAHGADPVEVGTPLSAWPLLTAAQAEELKALKFRTVESIAGASDTALQKMGMVAGMSPFAFRDRAAGFLAAAKDSSYAQQQADALKESQARESEMKAQIAELQEQMKTLAAPSNEPKRRGRPPKTENTQPERQVI
jgi:hypothetical protein